jgi:hypothetical protein
VKKLREFCRFALMQASSIIMSMEKLTARLGIVPFLLLGVGLLFIGLLSMRHVTNNFWPIDVSRLDLIRDAALDRTEATILLQAANRDVIVAFLAGVLVTVTGLVLPLAFFLNRRFGPDRPIHFLVVLRQAMWAGLWIAFCVWLQMNRTLNLGVMLLVAAVLLVIEFLLQIRTRAVEEAG